MSSPVGTILGGRYEIDEVIGRGGMSTVYRAHDLTLERWVAVKIMHREVARESEQLERFRREARAIANWNDVLFQADFTLAHFADFESDPAIFARDAVKLGDHL